MQPSLNKTNFRIYLGWKIELILKVSQYFLYVHLCDVVCMHVCVCFGLCVNMCVHVYQGSPSFLLDGFLDYSCELRQGLT